MRPILSTVYHLTLNGWPDRFSKVPKIARQFWGARDELSIEGGILLKGDCICIPSELYDRSLNELHDMQLGIEKNATQNKSHTILAWDRCWHCWICQMMLDMYPAQGYPAYSTNDPEGCTRSPLARPCCWLFQIQEQGVPTNCRYFQQIPLHF